MENVEPEAEVSLNSVVEFITRKTIKLKVVIGGQGVVTLIDSETTHNFIFLDLVK